VLGDAEGDWLPEMPATCIACWLQRSKSARLNEPAAIAVTGKSNAPIATDMNADFNVIMMLLLTSVIAGERSSVLPASCSLVGAGRR
jgi:hypothetical protein